MPSAINPIKKKKVGKVTSNKADKTITVTTSLPYKHPVYKKVIQKSTKFMAHDKENKCNIGDIVVIKETRPISKKKRWRVVEIVKKAVTL